MSAPRGRSPAGSVAPSVCDRDGTEGERAGHRLGLSGIVMRWQGPPGGGEAELTAAHVLWEGQATCRKELGGLQVCSYGCLDIHLNPAEPPAPSQGLVFRADH